MSIECGDGVTRRFVPAMLFVSGDHKEAQTHMGQFQSACSSFPCTSCLCPRADMGSSALDAHTSHPMRDVDHYLDSVERMMSDVGRGRSTAAATRAIGACSSQNMVVVAWARERSVVDKTVPFGGLCPPDLLHCVKEGIVEHLRTAVKTWADKWATELPGCSSKKASLRELDRRLQRVSCTRWPKWRLPVNDSRLYFDSEANFQGKEQTCVMQVRFILLLLLLTHTNQLICMLFVRSGLVSAFDAYI